MSSVIGPAAPPTQTSLSVGGALPRRRALILLLSVLGGLLIAYAWSAHLADDEIPSRPGGPS